MSTADLKLRLSTLGQQVARAAAAYGHAGRAVEQEQAARAAAERKLRTAEEAQRIVQRVAQAVQQQVHRGVAEVATRCLSAVFDEPYELEVRFDRKRGRTEARLVLLRDGVELEDPLNSVGGGVVDVAALALRLAAIVLSRPARRRLVVLDEPFKNIRGERYRQRTRSMLLALAAELGFQFLINTDIQAYRLGKVVELPAEN